MGTAIIHRIPWDNARPIAGRGKKSVVWTEPQVQEEEMRLINFIGLFIKSCEARDTFCSNGSDHGPGNTRTVYSQCANTPSAVCFCETSLSRNSSNDYRLSLSKKFSASFDIRDRVQITSEYLIFFNTFPHNKFMRCVIGFWKDLTKKWEEGLVFLTKTKLLVLFSKIENDNNFF